MRENRLLLVGLCLTVMLTSCQKETFQSIDIFQQFNDLEKLEPIEKRSIPLVFPSYYVVADSLLFVSEINQERFLRCFNLNTLEEVSFFIDKGRGLGELLLARTFSLYGTDSIQVIGEPNRIQVFAITDVLKGIEPENYKIVKIDDVYKIHSIGECLISSDSLLFAGLCVSDEQINKETQKRFILYSPSTGNYESFGEFNPLFFRDMELPSSGMSFINAPIIVFHPSKPMFVAATYNFKSIEIYDLKSKDVKASCYYELPIVETKTINEYFTITMSGEGQRGFSSVQCSEEFIYCLYRNEDNPEGNTEIFLFVYDWNLKPVRAYSMIADTSHGYVSADGRYFYTTMKTSDDNYELCKYEL